MSTGDTEVSDTPPGVNMSDGDVISTPNPDHSGTGFEMSFQDEEYVNMFNDLKLDVKSGKRDITQSISAQSASQSSDVSRDTGFDLDMEDMTMGFGIGKGVSNASPASHSSLESSGEPSKVTDLGSTSASSITSSKKEKEKEEDSNTTSDKENRDISTVPTSATSQLPTALIPERTSSLSPLARKKAAKISSTPSTGSPLASKGMTSFQTSSPPREMSFNSVIRHSSMHADSVIHHGLATLEDVDLGCDTDLESPESPEHFHMRSLDDNMFTVPANLDDKTVLGVKQERAHVDKLVNEKFDLQVENMRLRNNLSRPDGGSQAGGVDALRRTIRENNEMKEKVAQMEKELARKRDGGMDSEEIRELKERVVNYEEQIEYLEAKQQQQQQHPEWEDMRTSSGFGRTSRLSGSRAPSRATTSNHYTPNVPNRSISRQSFVSDSGSGGTTQRKFTNTPPYHSNRVSQSYEPETNNRQSQLYESESAHRQSQSLDSDEARVMEQMHELRNLIDPDGNTADADEDPISIYLRFSGFLNTALHYIVGLQEKNRTSMQEYENLEQDYQALQLQCAQESAEEIEGLREEIENLHADFSSQAQENDNLRHELTQHREEAQHYEREILELYPDIQTLENNNKRLKKDNEKKAKSLVELEEQLQGASAELQRAMELNEEMGVFVGTLEEQVEELKTGGVDGKEVERVKGELAKVSEELEAAVEQAALAKKEADAAKMEREMVKRERDDLKKEAEAQKTEVETRNVELGTRNVELETQKIEVVSLTSTVESLRSTVSSLQANLDQITSVIADNNIDVASMSVADVVSQLLHERVQLHQRVSEQEAIAQSSASELEQQLTETTKQLQLREQFTDDLENQLDDALHQIEHMGNHEARVEELTRQLMQFEEQFSLDRKHNEKEKAKLEAQIERVQADSDLRSAAHQKQLTSWQKKLFNVECNRGDFSKAMIEKLAEILGPVWKDAHVSDLTKLSNANSTPSAEVVTKLSNDALHDLSRLVRKGNSEITKQLHQLRVEVDSLKYKNNKHEEQYRSLSNLYKKAGLERDDFKKRLSQSEEEKRQLQQQQQERSSPRKKLGSGHSTASISSLGSDDEDFGRVQVTAREIDHQSHSSPMGKPFSSVLWGIRNEDIQQRLKLEKELRAADKAAADKKIKELENEISVMYRDSDERERRRKEV